MQSALVVDLRKGVRDPEVTDDAGTLPEKLRKRRALFATIADEIDELLRSKREAASGSLRPSLQQSELSRMASSSRRRKEQL